VTTIYGDHNTTIQANLWYYALRLLYALLWGGVNNADDRSECNTTGNNNNKYNKYTFIKRLSKDWSKRYPSTVSIEQPHLQASLENVNIFTLLQPLWETIPQQWLHSWSTSADTMPKNITGLIARHLVMWTSYRNTLFISLENMHEFSVPVSYVTHLPKHIDTDK
jgi:hypothetical protein